MVDEKKKHLRRLRVSSTTSPSQRVKLPRSIEANEEKTSYPSLSTPRIRHSGHREMRVEFVSETTSATIISPEMTTDISTRRRARRHHRRRYLSSDLDLRFPFASFSFNITGKNTGWFRTEMNTWTNMFSKSKLNLVINFDVSNFLGKNTLRIHPRKKRHSVRFLNTSSC